MQANYVNLIRRYVAAPLKWGVIWLYVNFNYQKTLLRVRRAYGKRKLRVLFVVGDPSKWKCQLVYDEMMQSDRYDPYVAPTAMDLKFIDMKFQPERVRKCIDFFARKNVRIMEAASRDDATPYPLNRFSPDIVIYQQPFGVSPNQSPLSVSKYALTFYAPYYLPAVGDASSQVTSGFHRTLFGNFLENEDWVKWGRHLGLFAVLGPKLFACGCPFREEIASYSGKVATENAVIYAPHWSFIGSGAPVESLNSTFLETGRTILDFAVKHPKIKWIFKPHPILRTKLIESHVWTEKEVSDYFDAWGKIGEVHLLGDYAPLFHRSRAMITDCLSFLSEYLIVNRPLIRLAHKTEPKPFAFPARKKLEGMYQVVTKEDLMQVLDSVILRDEDPLCDVRTQVVQQLGYGQNNVAHQMVGILDRILMKK